VRGLSELIRLPQTIKKGQWSSGMRRLASALRVTTVICPVWDAVAIPPLDVALCDR
jgi:hypothetical protein